MATIAEQIRERLAELEPLVTEYGQLLRAMNELERDNLNLGFRLENSHCKSIIAALSENPDGMQGPELAQYFKNHGQVVSAGSIINRIARMKREGIVTRRRRLSDSRIVYVLKERPDAAQE